MGRIMERFLTGLGVAALFVFFGHFAAINWAFALGNAMIFAAVLPLVPFGDKNWLMGCDFLFLGLITAGFVFLVLDNACLPFLRLEFGEPRFLGFFLWMMCLIRLIKNLFGNLLADFGIELVTNTLEAQNGRE